MAANFIQPPANTGLGLKVDTTELVVGANTVERQNICIADPVTAANIATVTAGGALKVDGSGGTQPISGSVTVVQGTGTNLHTVLDTGSNVIGHVIADTGSTTAVTGNVTAVQATGTNLHVVVDSAPTTAVTLASTTITGTVAENVTQVAGTTLGATAVVAYGSTPAAVVVPGVNAFITNAASISGNGTNAAASATGAAVPASADYQGVKVGANLVGVTGFTVGSTTAESVAIVDGSGNQITSFGGGSQFNMGSAQSSTAAGTISLGYDGTNVRGVLTDATGQLKVLVQNTPAVTLASTTITGNVTVAQATGTNLHAVLDAGTAVIGHVIADTGSTTTVTGTVAENLTQVAGTTLGATAVTNYGTAPAAAAVMGVNAFVTNTVPVSGSVTATVASTTVTNTVAENLTQVAGTAFALGQQLAAAALPVVLTAAQITTLTPPAVFGGVVTNGGTFAVQAAVTPPTLTKGTQGATGFSVQELKDAGRTYVALTATGIAGVIAEAIVTFSQNKAGTVTAGVTSYTITSGKTFRIQSIAVSVRAAASAVPFARCILRSNTAGATIATSSIVFNCTEVFGIAATIGVGGNEFINFPDGLEIAGNGTVSFGMSHLDQATTNILNISIYGYEY